jgi:6-phosphogluconolactonase
MTDYTIYSDPDSLVQAAAQHIIALAASSIASHGRFSLVLAGGSTPRMLYERLAHPDYASQIEWASTHIFWGDERFVPPDHPDSNYRMAREALLRRVSLPPTNVHRMRGELEPSQAAANYNNLLADFFGLPQQPDATTQPPFDLVLLGMGADGHTASLFPHTSAVREQQRRVVAHYVEALGLWRLTLTPPAINAARNVLFFVSGASKAARLRAVLRGPVQPEVQPAQAIRPTHGTLVWLIDADAANELEHEP